jgi:hypothetical protein
MNKTWIGLSIRERNLLLDALQALRAARHDRISSIDRLTAKLVHAAQYPEITIGVRRGQVQWVKGNPFPIRVLDYDNDYCDAPDVDEHGQRCWLSIEPRDRRHAARASS